jgi:hypothetical protein
MNGRQKGARLLVALGSFVLFASAALHGVAATRLAFPALAASNLSPALQAAFQVMFLSATWHWVVIAVIALAAAFTETKLRKFLVLVCGLAVVVEAGVGASMMGLFIGNEMIGTGGLLIALGGLLF